MKKEEFTFICKGCGKKIILRATKVNLQKKFCSIQCRSNSIVPWNKGLTKETDERIKEFGQKQSEIKKKLFEEGKLTSWNEGLTKETDERVKSASEKTSSTKKKLFEEGKLTSWNEGLTKETDERVLRNAINTKKSMKELMKDENSLVYKNHMYRSLIGAKKAQEQKGFTDIEVILYSILDEIDIYFFKQYEIHKWIVDAFIPESNLIVQADGEYWHNKKDVAQRDFSSTKYLQKCGFKVLRFWGENLKNKPDKIKDVILHAL